MNEKEFLRLLKEHLDLNSEDTPEKISAVLRVGEGVIDDMADGGLVKSRYEKGTNRRLVDVADFMGWYAHIFWHLGEPKN